MLNLLIVIAFTSFCTASHAQFFIFGNANQSNITNSGFDVSFSSSPAAQGLLKYGKTSSLELGYIGNGQSTSSHNISLNNLTPATIYYVRPAVVSGTDTILSTKTAVFSTSSNSTGRIKVFFNNSIDNTVSNGTYPDISNSPAAIQAELIKRIDSAKTKIDCAIYNNNTNAIVTALNNAFNRGVRVRYIYDDGTSNTSLSSALFPKLGVNTSNLMHNKFMVIDPDSVNTSYVWTGSMNWTSGNINTDYNNVVLIQDQSLARTYVLEFEEMWGSNAATSNAANSRAGSLKSDNTPHQFIIGGKQVECYFSPSDKVTDQIVRSMRSAGGDLEFLIFSFTQDDIKNAIVEKHQSGETVAGIIDNINDIGCEYTPLLNAGVDVMADNHAADLHHKYAIIDANTVFSDPQVITGSHNWSNNAENNNDENTLIIHDANIANWYLQEFSKRYCEVKGGSNCRYNPAVPVENIINNELEITVFPNPTNSNFYVKTNMENHQEFFVKVYDQLGQLVFNNTASEMGNTIEINSANWSNGIYFIQVLSGNLLKSDRISIIK